MISDLSKESWDKKVIDLGGSFLQSWVWGEFQNTLGFKTHRFSSDNYANSVNEFPLQFGKKYLYSSRGPIGDAAAALADLNNLSADRAFVFARLESQHGMDLPKAAKDNQPTHNWLLDITKTEDELLAAMKSKHRYNIGLAAKKGVVVREGSKADILTVYKLLLETARRAGFRLHPQNYYLQMFEHLHPTNLKILIAEHEGDALSAMILVYFGDTATYLHGGGASVKKEFMAPYLLHWAAIKISKQLGLKHYDFGGVAPETEPNHAWAGISRFKKGFGGFEVVYPGAFDLIFSPLWYNVYKNARSLRDLLRNHK